MISDSLNFSHLPGWSISKNYSSLSDKFETINLSIESDENTIISTFPNITTIALNSSKKLNYIITSNSNDYITVFPNNEGSICIQNELSKPIKGKIKLSINLLFPKL